MGSILRLERRCELLDQRAASATVVTEVAKRVSSGWVALIRPHDKPDERLRRWSRTELRASEMEISTEGKGSKTYLELPDGIFEAHSVWRDERSHKCVFEVADGQIEILDMRGLRDDDVLGRLLDLTPRQLETAREARLQSLHDSAIAAGMVALEGSEKQIRWVAEFRLAKFLDASDYLRERFKGLEAMPLDDPSRYKHEVAIEWLGVALFEMSAKAEASWWIAVVGVKGRETLRAMAKSLRDSGAWLHVR
jgi:hypothetical protein